MEDVLYSQEMPESTEEPVLFSQESQLDEASDSNVIQFNHTNGCQSFKIKIDPHSVYHVGFNQIIGGDHIRIYDPVRSQNKQPQLISGHHADIKTAASGIWLIQFGRSGSRISRGDVTKYVTSGTKDYNKEIVSLLVPISPIKILNMCISLSMLRCPTGRHLDADHIRQN